MNSRNVLIALYLIGLFSLISFEVAWGWGSKEVVVSVVGMTHYYINGRLDPHETITVSYNGILTTLHTNCNIENYYQLEIGINMTYTPVSLLHGALFQYMYWEFPFGCYNNA